MSEAHPFRPTGRPVAPPSRGDPRADLGDFLAHLHDLLADDADILEFLEDMASMTAGKLTTKGNTVACGVTVIRHKKPATVADSDALARKLDDLQGSFGEGPCLHALRTRTMVQVHDVGREQRWPDYMAAAAATEVGSILALPMELDGAAEAVVNLYATRKYGFTQQDVMVAGQLAAAGAQALRLALRIASLSDAKDNLAAVLESRTTIDTAVGIIMAQNRCTRDHAFQILASASSHRNVKLREVAAGIVANISGERNMRAAFDE